MADFKKIFCLAAAIGMSQLPVYCKEAEHRAIGEDEELNALQIHHKMPVHVRACRSYFCADLKDYDVLLVSQAPDWIVQEINTKRKLYAETPLKIWLRRGVPLNFLRLGTLPDWPTVRVNEKIEQGVPVDIYALPYVTEQHRALPVSRGKVGEMTVFGGFPGCPAGKILGALYHIPSVDGLPLDMRLFAKDDPDTKYNSLFVFSGAATDCYELQLKKIWVTKRQPIPGTQGCKLCKDSREIWVNRSETEGINELNGWMTIIRPYFSFF